MPDAAKPHRRRASRRLRGWRQKSQKTPPGERPDSFGTNGPAFWDQWPDLWGPMARFSGTEGPALGNDVDGLALRRVGMHGPIS